MDSNDRTAPNFLATPSTEAFSGAQGSNIERRTAAQEYRARLLDFWRQELRETPEVLQLPADSPRRRGARYTRAELPLVVSGDISDGLAEVAVRHDVSLNTVLLASWAILLSRWSGQYDIVFGARLPNGNRKDCSLVEPLECLTAIRVLLQPEQTVKELLGSIAETFDRVAAYQDITIDEIAASLESAGGPEPLFHVQILLPGSHAEDLDLPGRDLGDVTRSGLPVERNGEQEIQQELSLVFETVADGLTGVLSYAAGLFRPQTIERMVGSWEVLVRSMRENSQIPISRLHLLTANERERLRLFNGSASDRPRDVLIHQLFEQQSERTPEAIAIICGQQRLSFAELNSKANQLAQYLRERGIRPDQLVGVLMERSTDLVVALLAVLKAGGAYVPMDPAYPAERLSYMLEDSAPRLVLTHRGLQNLLPISQQVISVDSEWSRTEVLPKDNPPLSPGLTDRNLAFVIYTSGSTGKPKAAMNEHRGVVNRLFAQPQMEGYCDADVCSQKTSISFVDAVFEIFGALCAGRPLVIIPAEAVIDTSQMAALIAEHRVTQLTTVPSLARAMLDNEEVMRQLSSLRAWTLSGEEVRPDLVTKLQQRLPECEFIVLYGASEVSSDATYYKTREFAGERVPIGWPVPSVQVHILDPHGEPQPVGVVGEIYIGGVGVGRGYLNKPELTASRFVPDRFGSASGGRLYRTGDLGRWLPDGTLECLGRNDQQVKIRGFRIELGEIELQLLQHEMVCEAVVAVRRESNQVSLIAYVTLRDPQAIGKAVLQPADTSIPQLLRDHLRAYLPDYMIPVGFVVLESLPRTPNGKVNRNGLPEPGLSAYISRQYEMPCGELEWTVARIWQDVLRIERVGRQDNFFELGGNSLQIARLLQELSRAGLRADVRRVYGSPTLAQMCQAMQGRLLCDPDIPPNLIPSECVSITPDMLTLIELEPEHIESIARTATGGMSNIQDIYPLSPLQEGMLFHYLLDENQADTYLESILLSVSSPQRLEDLISACQKLIDRHDILRTAIMWEGLPRPVQVVHRSALLQVERVADPDMQISPSYLEQWLEPSLQGLDLSKPPLMRLRVTPSEADGHFCVALQIHHIVSDQVTTGLLISQLVGHLQGAVEAPPDPVSYRNHVAKLLKHSPEQDAESFFRRKLSDVDEPTAPFGVVHMHEVGRKTREARQELDADLVSRIRRQAKCLRVSIATLLHAAWGLVVAHTSGRDDIVFGSVLSGRLQVGDGTERALGMYINTLPVRLRLAGLTAVELTEQTHNELGELLTHEQASLVLAQRCSSVTPPSQLFSALLNYRYGTAESKMQWTGAEGIQWLGEYSRTNYPITLSVDDAGSGLSLLAQTDESVDARRVTGYMATALQSLVEALERAPATPALLLSIIPEDERLQLANGLHSIRRPYPHEKLIHELFEEQVAQTPDVVAVMYGDQQLTYEQLNRKANQLARSLLDLGVAADQPVGICLPRGLEMVVGLVAILKAGGAYVPLDPSYPAERLQQMLEDATPSIILTQEELRGVLPDIGAEVISLDVKLREISDQVGENLPDLGLTSLNLVYVIYTSGSTGRPKGVAMAHRSMVNLIEWHRSRFGSGRGRRVLQFAALSFDVAFQEIFTTLCSGATLVLLNEWIRRDARALAQFIMEHEIERLFLPPLMLQSLAEEYHAGDDAPHNLRDVITAGEQLRITPEILCLFNRLSECRLHNHYGPTESHVVTALTLSEDPWQWPVLPTIGVPITNAQVHILDDRLSLVPIGVVGEICIGGVAVARGYLTRPDLTAQRFVDDPFAREKPAKMYRTGDLGRWTADGTLEYLGRNDRQVKIRGFRVELGDVEAQLLRLNEVKEAVVLARDDVPGQKRLVAYVVPKDGGVATVDVLRTRLLKLLPEHMQPSAFVLLEHLPVTPTGKLDRRSLPDPEPDSFRPRQLEAPRTVVEQAIAKIWQELLRVTEVGRQDNFFQLGGHSLSAMQVVVRIRSRISVDVPVRRLFEHPTLENFAAQVEMLREEALLEQNASNNMQQLLTRVASMPDHEVRQLMRELKG